MTVPVMTSTRLMPAGRAAERREVALAATLPVEHALRRARSLDPWLEHLVPAVAVRAMEFIARLQVPYHGAKVYRRAGTAPVRTPRLAHQDVP